MLDILKYYIKHFKFVFFLIPISLFLMIVCLIQTNEYAILKGDTTIFSDVVKVDTLYEAKGSFSTIYVYDYKYVSLFQSFIIKKVNVAEVYENNPNSRKYTLSESILAGKIQYDSGLSNSLIVAYKNANKIDSSININYSFQGFFVTGYGISSDFRINDNIVKIKAKSNGYEEVDFTNEELFRKVINDRTIGDTYKVIRDGKELEIILRKEDTFSAYSKYLIKDSNPTFKTKTENVGGPSGGLLQALSTYNQLVSYDITNGLKICGTGTIWYDGTVGEIGGIKEKIYTANDDRMDVFFCPKDNYDEALIAYNSIKNTKMKLIKVTNFSDCIDYLTEGYENDFR